LFNSNLPFKSLVQFNMALSKCRSRVWCLASSRNASQFG